EILAIGRIEDVKNIDVLLSCFADIKKTVSHAKLRIAGEYTGQSPQQTAEYRSKLEMLIDTLQLRDAVIFEGIVQGEAKQELFANADLLINLSTDPGETFGFNLIEAKAAGVPVVCTRWDGFQELVQDGVDGFLADCEW